MFNKSKEIKAHFGSPKKITLKEFMHKVVIYTTADKEYSLKEYMKHLKKTDSYRGDEETDPRLTRRYWENVYDFYYVHWDAFVHNFIKHNLKTKDSTAKFTVKEKHLYQNDDLRVIDGGNKPKGRLNKALFWRHIYNTPSSAADRRLVDQIVAITEFRLNSHLVYPSLEKYFVQKDYSSMFMSIRATYPTLSVFNPYAYANIIDNILHAKKLFCPVLSWCSPVIAAANSKGIEHLVTCDVIPDVVDTSRVLFDHLTKDEGLGLVVNTKKYDAFCCPSEQLAKKHKFDKKYKNYFDTVFFSPPYFDLEMYEGGDQSIESYPDYSSWLEGYWDKTVKLCFDTLQHGGTFSFVIVPNYKSRTEKCQLQISKDMLKIAKRYFLHVDTKNLAWSNFNGVSSSEKRNSDSFMEDFHILKKRW